MTRELPKFKKYSLDALMVVIFMFSFEGYLDTYDFNKFQIPAGPKNSPTYLYELKKLGYLQELNECANLVVTYTNVSYGATPNFEAAQEEGKKLIEKGYMELTKYTANDFFDLGSHIKIANEILNNKSDEYNTDIDRWVCVPLPDRGRYDVRLIVHRFSDAGQDGPLKAFYTPNYNELMFNIGDPPLQRIMGIYIRPHGQKN